MTIKNVTKIDTTLFGYPRHEHAYSILLEVELADAKKEAADLLSIITDSSWANKLDVIDRKSLLACAQPTIEKIVHSILEKVETTIGKEFGEYLISYSAQRVLIGSFSHTEVPLPELYKEKISGNPGFDFHTISPSSLIVFGEAKYTSSKSPYGRAEHQINDFLQDIPNKNKHKKDLSLLRKFTGDTPANNVINGQFGVAAAFSIHSNNETQIMVDSINYKEFAKMLDNSEVYIIGVHFV